MVFGNFSHSSKSRVKWHVRAPRGLPLAKRMRGERLSTGVCTPELCASPVEPAPLPVDTSATRRGDFGPA